MISARVGLVVNPVHARAMHAADAVIAHELAGGHSLPRVRHTTIAEPGGLQARELAALGCRTVVAVGGDGTVREVAYALAQTSTPLGIIPTGTANLIARNLTLPAGLAKRVRVAVEGPVRRIDLGVARLDEGPELPFLAYAGVGQDAATVADTRSAWKAGLGPLGWLAYLAAGVRHLLRGPSPMSVALDGGDPVERELWCVLAGNAGRVPAGIRVFPAARIDDGRLHVLEVSGDPARWALVAAEGVTGRGIVGSGLRRRSVDRVEVRLQTPQPVQLDGDLAGPATRVRFAVHPGSALVRSL